MKGKFFRVAVLIGFLLPLCARSEAATLSNASLQGNYFFVLEEVEPCVLFAFCVTTAEGILAFDQNGNVTVRGQINRDGTVEALSTAGTYSVAPSGAVQVSLPNLSLSASGGVSVDLSSIVLTNVSSGAVFSQDILLAVKQPAGATSTSFLNGKYFVAERTMTASGSTPQFENSTGTLSFDGAGNCTLAVQMNRYGFVTPVNEPGTYQISADGTVLLKLADRSATVTLGFSPDGSLGVGATVQAQSSATHDLFTLTKAGTGVGNAALNGSYQMMVSSFNSAGFSTAAGQAVYTGDGKGSYQLVTGAGSTGNGSGTVAVADDGTLQFSAVPNTPGSFQGGVGASGNAWVAAAISDPSLWDFAIAIRTSAPPPPPPPPPSQPTINGNGVVNGASYTLTSSSLAPGSIASIFGSKLSDGSVCVGPNCGPSFDANGKVIPTLAGAQVTFGAPGSGINAPILSTPGSSQLNVQVPVELAGAPLVSVVVTFNNQSSVPSSVSLTPFSPGLISADSTGSGQGAILNDKDANLGVQSFVAPVGRAPNAHPAAVGDVIEIYGTGLGAVTPAVATGMRPQGSPQTVTKPTVTIGGIQANVVFSGLANCCVGLNQVNVVVPPGVAPGDRVQVELSIGGITSNRVTIAVQ